MMCKCIFFDAYGTLFDVFSVASACESQYKGQGDSISQLWRAKQLEYSWLRTLMKRYKDFWSLTEDALRYALKSLALPYDASVVDKLMSAYHHLSDYPEVKEALTKLHPRKLVVLTNGNTKMMAALLENTRLNEYLDGFISADDVKLYKPRPEVYQYAMDKMGVAKEDVLFVSSNGWDIAGAKSFGFQTAWINRFNKTVEELDVVPDYEIKDLQELTELLANESGNDQ